MTWPRSYLWAQWYYRLYEGENSIQYKKRKGVGECHTLKKIFQMVIEVLNQEHDPNKGWSKRIVVSGGRGVTVLCITLARFYIGWCQKKVAFGTSHPIIKVLIFLYQKSKPNKIAIHVVWCGYTGNWSLEKCPKWLYRTKIWLRPNSSAPVGSKQPPTDTSDSSFKVIMGGSADFNKNWNLCHILSTNRKLDIRTCV